MFSHRIHLNGIFGSTSATSGAQPSSQTYYPYGAVRSGTLPTDYTFTGQKVDASAGLMYYGARYYDAALGRFIQPDTIIPNLYDPQALNRYSYVLNNPVKYTDPTGHREDCGMEGCDGKLPDDTTSDAKFLAVYREAGINYENYLRAKYVLNDPVLADAYAGAFGSALGQARNLTPQHLWTQAQSDAVVTDWILAGFSSVMAFNMPLPSFAPTIGVPPSLKSDVFPDPYVGTRPSIKALYPPNDGFAGQPSRTTLPKGTVIDRYGPENGRYASPAGTPIEQRALPYRARSSSLHTYEVIRPLEVDAGQTRAWFGAQGGGIQYRFDVSISNLIREGYLRVLP